jgi:hypothetical protein
MRWNKYIIINVIMILLSIVSSTRSETDYDVLLDGIDNYRNVHAKAMTVREFENIIIDNKLTPMQVAEAYKRYMKTQNPIIDKGSLRDIYVSKIESVTTFNSELDIEITGNEGTTRSFIRTKYVSDGRKVFSEIKKGDDFHNLVLDTRLSFDGKAWRKMRNKDNLGAGTISQRDLTDRIYKSYDFLRLCMLRKKPKNMPEPFTFDLIGMLGKEATVIQEQMESINGTDCLLITDGLTTVYLDPERGFTVMKVTQSTYPKDEAGRYLSKHERYARIFHEFVDCGNGVWIPKRVEEVGENHRITNRYTIRQLKVNKPVAGSVFTEIFRVGDHVMDEISGLEYIVGSSLSIEATIDEKLESVGIVSEDDEREGDGVWKNSTPASVTRPDDLVPSRNPEVDVPLSTATNNKLATSIIVVSSICILMFCLGLFANKIYGRLYRK